MKKLIAANWKMYKTIDEARATGRELVSAVAGSLPADREVLVCPPFTALHALHDTFKNVVGFAIGGQDVYPATEGAYTGEIAPGMLLDAGCGWVLTGHSERRHILGEDDETVARKTAFSLKAGLRVVLCIGEKLDEREAGRLEDVLAHQLQVGLADVDATYVPQSLVVAYEPVWAIGTGKVAGPAEVVEAHALVRSLLEARYGRDGAAIRILYGGSVKPDNAAELLSLDNVDGLLVGGASLQAVSFSRIILA